MKFIMILLSQTILCYTAIANINNNHTLSQSNKAAPFYVLWNTKNTNEWSSSKNQIELPIKDNSTIIVDWGDGTKERLTVNSTNKLYTYSNPGTYEISIIGEKNQESFHEMIDEDDFKIIDNRKKLIEIFQWGK